MIPHKVRPWCITIVLVVTVLLHIYDWYRSYAADLTVLRPELKIAGFPSTQDRVKLFTSHWYDAPCYDTNGKRGCIRYSYSNDGHNVRLELTTKDDSVTTIDVCDVVQHDKVFLLHPSTIRQCSANSTNTARSYCNDIVNTMLPLLNKLSWYSEDNPVPILLQFGDATTYGPFSSVPHIMKFRHNTEYLARKNQNPEGIVWLLDIDYHYSKVFQIDRFDIPWQDKLPKAVFRGKLTGSDGNIANEEQRCLYMPRCRIAYTTSNSSLVDAKLSSTIDRVPDIINGIQIVGNKLSVQDQLQYKAIVMLEGNDVGSGVKWALYSKSVLIMPEPTKTSYAMEELLQPWIHYIPINQDASNIEEMVQWMVQHDKEAELIAKHGRLWIHNMLFRNESGLENTAISYEILERYRRHFNNNSSI